MDVGTFQNRCLRTANTAMPQLDDHDAATLNYALGIAGEAGEIADMIKKHLFHGHDLVLDNLVLEAGDVLWYLAMILSINGRTLDDSMELVIAKLNKRFRDGFSSQASINRSE